MFRSASAMLFMAVVGLPLLGFDNDPKPLDVPDSLEPGAIGKVRLTHGHDKVIRCAAKGEGGSAGGSGELIGW